VLARQKDGRPAEVVASNAGQVLWGGIASQRHEARVVERLMAPDMFSGWGIRTLSMQAAAYNPMSYHCGSVWPHDNGLIANGFHRYGREGAALRVLDALFAAASGFRDFRMPELYCGYERRTGEEHPVRYPVACSPQAWAAGAIPHLLRSVLGLRADAVAGRLEVVRPRLPAWLDWVEVECMRVGAARIDVRFERAGPDGVSDVHSVVREGDLCVEHIEALPPEDS
jgi:glycogen debranching enzyme